MGLRTPAKPENPVPEQSYFQRGADASARDDEFSRMIDNSYSKGEQDHLSKAASEGDPNFESPEDLNRKESGAGSGAQSAVGKEESGAGFMKKAISNAAMAGAPAPVKALDKIRGALSTRKGKAGAGVGGITGVIVTLFIMLGSTSILVMAKENVVEVGNMPANSRLERHLAKSAGHTLKRMHTEATFADKISKQKFATKMEKAGFKVEWTEDNKLLKSLSYNYVDADGKTKTRYFDFGKSADQAGNDFFGNDAPGKKALHSFNKVNYGHARAWRMAGAKKVTDRFKITFKNVFGEEPSEKAKTLKQKFASLWRNSTVGQAAASISGDTRADKEDGGKQGEIFPENDKVTQQGNELGDQLRENPTIGNEAIGGASSDPDLRQAGDEIRRGVNDGLNIGDVAEKAIAKAPAAALRAVAGSLNVAGTTADSCSLVGAMSYAQYIKSTAMAGQLTVFFFTMMTAADHQKAGLLNTQGLTILLTALRDNSAASGRNFFNSGGMQYAMGNTSARPNADNLATYNVGRSNEGTLAKIYDFVTTTFPFSVGTNPNTCKVATNTFVTIGGTVVGAVAAVFTLGGSATVNVAARLTMTGLRVVALTYIEQMIIKTAAGMAIDGLSENGEQLGDAAGSGAGVAMGSINNANGLRPATVEQAEAAYAEAADYREFAMSQENVFDRYLGMNGQSLVGSAILSQPTLALWSSPETLVSSAIGLFSPGKTLASLGGILPGTNKVYAATNNNCSDPRFKQANLACTPFGSTINIALPDLSVEETYKMLIRNGDIDSDGQPIAGSAYEKYQQECLSGRSDLLAKDLGDADKDDIMKGTVRTNEYTDDCIVAGPTTADGKAYPGGQFDRYAVWHATQNQVDGLITSINDDFGGSGNASDFEVSDGSGDASDAARKILELEQQGKLSFLGWGDTSDRSEPKQNIEDTAEGGKAKTTQHRRCTEGAVNAKNKSTNIDVGLLNFIAELAESSGQIIKINALAGQCHSATSKHYDGTAVDFGCPFDPSTADRIAEKHGVKRYDGEDCTPARGSHYHYSTSGY